MKKISCLLFACALIVSCSKKKEVTPVKEQIEKGPEWVHLFDGESLDKWRFYNGGEINEKWTIEEGAMFFAGREEGFKKEFNIVSKEKYTNFELYLEWKISEGGNSGIFWGIHEDMNLKEPWRTGPEIQVLDNERHPDALVNPKYHQAGALYDLVQPTQDVCNPAGEWNAVLLKINHKTNKGSAALNGVVVVEFPVHGEKWDALLENSKFEGWEKFGKYAEGHIGLQDHGDKVWYRNIKIKKLD